MPQNPEANQEQQEAGPSPEKAKAQADAYNRANNSLRLDRLAESGFGLDGLARLSENAEIGQQLKKDNQVAAQIEGEVKSSIFTPLVGEKIVRDVVAAQKTGEINKEFEKSQNG